MRYASLVLGLAALATTTPTGDAPPVPDYDAPDAAGDTAPWPANFTPSPVGYVTLRLYRLVDDDIEDTPRRLYANRATRRAWVRRGYHPDSDLGALPYPLRTREYNRRIAEANAPRHRVRP